MSKWQPIEAMPRDHDGCADTYWGPEVVLLVPACKHFHCGPTIYVGHLEADMWLVRNIDNPGSWGELHCAPTHWLPLPYLPVV